MLFLLKYKNKILYGILLLLWNWKMIICFLSIYEKNIMLVICFIYFFKKYYIYKESVCK